MAFYLPQNNWERAAWAQNFMRQFAEIAPEYGFSADEAAKVSAACETLVYAVRLAHEAKMFSKACTSFRDSALMSREKKPLTVPVFVAPAAPAVLGEPDALRYLQKIVRRLKAQANYSSPVGIVLRIVAPESAVSTANARPPKFKGLALPNSVVRLDWRKGKFEGVIVYGQYAGETQWTEIGRDLHSPFIDTRLPREPGKPEARRYRMIYMLKDEPVGDYSYIVDVSTIP